MKDPVLKAELLRAEVETPEELIASFFLGPKEIASFTAGADINTDDNAKLEYAAPLDLLSENRARLAREIRTVGWPYGRLGELIVGADSARATRLARSLVGYGRFREAEHWVERARQTGAGDTASSTALLIQLAKPVDYRDPELPITAGGPSLSPPTPELFTGDVDERRAGIEMIRRAYEHLAEGEWTPAWNAVRELPAMHETDAAADIALLRGYLAYKALKMRAARKILRRLATDEAFERRPATRYYLARALLGLGKFEEGTAHLTRFVSDHPELAKQAAESRL